MILSKIYSDLAIIPNLAEHMFRVTGIILFIKDHWKGNFLDWNVLEKASLLHDVGNLVKFDLDNNAAFLGSEIVNVKSWKQRQAIVISKYGDDDHRATQLMLTEVGLPARFIEIVVNMSLSDAVRIASSPDWYSKILLYADMRVMPGGISTLLERLADIRKRKHNYSCRSDFDDLVEACEIIENQIQKNVDVPLALINSDSVKFNKEIFLRRDI